MTTSATTSSTVQISSSSISGPHRKDFYTGIYLNPLGFIQAGPIVGAEFTIKQHFIIDMQVRFPMAGLLTGVLWGCENATKIKGIGVGLSAKYFTGGPKGGFYAGPAVEYWTTNIHYGSGGNYYYEGTGLVVAANLGYKFQFSSGFYIRTGGALGTSLNLDAKQYYYSHSNYSDFSGNVHFFGMLDFSLGIAF
jgi:hypothetical protein